MAISQALAAALLALDLSGGSTTRNLTQEQRLLVGPALDIIEQNWKEQKPPEGTEEITYLLRQEADRRGNADGQVDSHEMYGVGRDLIIRGDDMMRDPHESKYGLDIEADKERPGKFVAFCGHCRPSDDDILKEPPPFQALWGG